MKWPSFLRFLSSSEAKIVPLAPPLILEVPKENLTEELLVTLANFDSGENIMITQDKLNTITAAVQTVESLSASAIAATGTAPTNQQKLQAAIAIATTVDPTLQPVAVVLPSLIASLVNIFNSWGIFKKKPTAPASASLQGVSAVSAPSGAAGLPQNTTATQ